MPVDANGRSILHKGHGMTHTCAVPDVCKTPSPGGPVPIPYVNVAMDSNITNGASSVKIDGNPVANVKAKIATSMGDEPGTAGGVMSSKFKGAVTWKMGSLNVKAEGKSVVRFLDNAFHNGNSFNTSFIDAGKTGVAYADDFEGPCAICGKESDEHKILETVSSAKLCAAIVDELKETFKSASANDKKKYAKYRKRSKSYGGYMVGVMVCKLDTHTPHTFAAMSGTYVLSGFNKIAGKHVDQVVGGGGFNDDGPVNGALSQADYAGANTSGLDAAKIAGAVSTKWEKVEQRLEAKDKKYSYLGICAGAHLLAKSGHAPMAMTEMFFAPTGDWRIEGKRQAGREFGTSVHRFTPWGNTVASCHTCQDLLPLTMCPVRTCG